jgi:hypothetical protein
MSVRAAGALQQRALYSSVIWMNLIITAWTNTKKYMECSHCIYNTPCQMQL